MNPSVIKSDLLKEELYMKEYPCGLKAFIIPKKGYSKKIWITFLFYIYFFILRVNSACIEFAFIIYLESKLLEME